MIMLEVKVPHTASLDTGINAFLGAFLWINYLLSEHAKKVSRMTVSRSEAVNYTMCTLAVTVSVTTKTTG